jgi:sporulation protein YlmC with PRC-barrel domain
LGRLLIEFDLQALTCSWVCSAEPERNPLDHLRRNTDMRVASGNGTCGEVFFPDHLISGRNHMSFKYISAAVAASALLASVAFAQTPTATSDRSNMAASETSSSFQGDWRASKVVGLSVYNDNNQSIGSINDLLTDKSGNIKAAVIGVGGFLGVGEHLVVIPYDKIKFVNEPVAYVGASGNANGQPPSNTTGSASTTGAASTATSSKPNPWYPDHAVYNATKDELKAMPEFKYSTN